MSFQQLGLSPALLANLAQLKYETPTPIQAQAVPAIRSGTDLVATAQTGSGKTAAFLMPILDRLQEHSRGTIGGLVLSPTRELAKQTHEVFRNLSMKMNLRSALVVGGVPTISQIRTLRSGVEFVVATPGRLLDLMDQRAIKLEMLRTVVLDEADQMFDLGFLPTLNQIMERLPKQRQTLLFSATMPAPVRQMATRILTKPTNITVGQIGAPNGSVSQTAYPVPHHLKAALLQHFLEQWERPCVLVFTRTKHGARHLTRKLFDEGHRVEELHGNRSPSQRERAMRGFRAGTIPVLVATNIAARGIDVRHITHVVNFDVPEAPEEYVHRIGRVGRAGDTGTALVFVSPEENGRLARIEREIGKRLPREHVAEFDYGATPPPKQRLGDAPTNRPAFAGPKRSSPKGPWVKQKQKPTRGQGRR